MTKLKNSNCDNLKYDKSQFMKKHCENRKTLPREHLIGCEGVKIFLLRDPFKSCFSFLIETFDISSFVTI